MSLYKPIHAAEFAVGADHETFIIAFLPQNVIYAPRIRVKVFFRLEEIGLSYRQLNGSSASLGKQTGLRPLSTVYRMFAADIRIVAEIDVAVSQRMQFQN